MSCVSDARPVAALFKSTILAACRPETSRSKDGLARYWKVEVRSDKCQHTEYRIDSRITTRNKKWNICKAQRFRNGRVSCRASCLFTGFCTTNNKRNTTTQYYKLMTARAYPVSTSPVSAHYRVHRHATAVCCSEQQSNARSAWPRRGPGVGRCSTSGGRKRGRDQVVGTEAKTINA